MMLTKKELSGALSLSCVENYFLAWLGKRCDVTKLYGDSFVGLRQVFDDFTRGATYENYCYIPRLQDIAEEYGIVSHSYYSCTDKKAVELLEALSADELGLIRVNQYFFKGFKRAAWREDHYVCADGSLTWINNYPLAEGGFTKEDFGKTFDGAVCIYRPENTAFSPPDFCTEAMKRQSFENIRVPRGLKELESALGILRVMRKRLEKYFAGRERVRALLKEENEFLDKLYFTARLLRIKKCGGDVKDDLSERAERIVEMEKKIAEEMKK